jgi:hypothetical protein
MSSRSKIHGAVTLTMPSGVTHTMSNRLVLQLMDDVGRIRKGDTGPIPESVYEQFDELRWFRDAVENSSTSGHLHEMVLMLVHGPAATPAEQPVREVSAA